MRRSFRAWVLVCLAVTQLGIIGQTLQAGELSYQQTVGDVLTSVTVGMNELFDESYAARENEVQPMVISGQEAAEMLSATGFQADERDYLEALLHTPGAKAIYLEGELNGGGVIEELYIPNPATMTGVSTTVPESFQGKKGIWVDVSQRNQNCQWIFRTVGQAYGCDCYTVYERCCGAHCTALGGGHCTECSNTQGSVLRLFEQHGIQEKWTSEVSFDSVEPNENLGQVAHPTR